jgi:uncharacterized protein YecE (DUF72 family)
MNKQWYVGTSGFMIGQKTWLSLPYLNCIEINSTFYRLPNAKTVQKWKHLAPNLFFSIKASRYITHIKRLKNCKGAWDKFWKVIKPLGNKMRAILIQLPPSFKNTPETFKRLERMKQYLPRSGPSIIFEFRDKSWFTKEVTALFTSAGWTIGGTLINRKKGVYWLGNMPTGIHIPPKTSNTTYIRIHGEKGYKKYYNTKTLREIKQQIMQHNTKNNFVMFNNVFFTKRNRTCRIQTKKNKTRKANDRKANKLKRIRYAAVCDAVLFGKMTMKKRHPN